MISKKKQQLDLLKPNENIKKVSENDNKFNQI